uniref:cGMP-dependent protein kinase n=1 Tax=Amphiprion percula TaxID=161767 RepID=A0A3P8TDI0_AMPPE
MGTLRDLQFALQLKIEELRQRDTLIDELELELDTKDELIRRLQEELDRYRTTVSLPGPSAAAVTEDDQTVKRMTVISEPFSLDPVTLAMVSQRSCDKSQESQRLIQAAFLKSDLLKNLDEGEIRAIIACMYRSTINQGCYVVQEGTVGAQAYVLEEGRLDMTKDGLKLLTVEPEDMFGELALLYSCTHTYSVSAQTDSKLWVIDRKSYQTVLMQCGLNRLSHSMHYSNGDYIIRQGATGDTFYVINKGQVKFYALCLEDIRTVNVIATGDVTCLVIDRDNSKCLFAMKVLRKKLILNNGQQEHILREGRILMEVNCPFIVRCLLHKTFRDAENVYVLTEACLGGDLSRFLNECSTRFYTACVVEALTFLHHQGVVYRDVKPENVILDDLHFIQVEVGKKAWTFCGTLGYMPPEIILNKGHSISADFWSLGVFVFELLSGGLPFSDSDPMKILTASIRGIDQIDFPKTISKSASSLIKKLCRCKYNPLNTLEHNVTILSFFRWFEGFNWDGLCKRTLNPPVIPKVKHPLESSACALYPEDSVELCTNWDKF